MLLAGTVFAAARALVDDEEQDIATDTRLAPLCQMAQEALIAKCFANPNIGRAKSIVVVGAVPAGTNDLSSYFQTGKALELLTSVISMREKQAGSDDSNYLPMEGVGDLPSVIAVNYNQQYTFTGDTILLPGASQALDFRIFGTFDPRAVVDQKSPLIPNTGLILKFGTAALFCASRNPELAKSYEDKAMLYTNLWMNVMIMELQEQSTRSRPFGESLLSSDWW